MNLFIQINKKILNGYATYIYKKMKIKVIEKISKLLNFFSMWKLYIITCVNFEEIRENVRSCMIRKVKGQTRRHLNPCFLIE